MWGMVLSSGIPIGRQVKGTRSLQQAPLRCRRCSIISCSDEVQLMEGHPLLRVVENWQGRGPTQLAFEARGFTIHKARQSRIIQFCGEQQSHLLNRYWDEVALETMQSLGQGNPDTRGFVIQPRYRSSLAGRTLRRQRFCRAAVPVSACCLSNACSIAPRGSILMRNFGRMRSPFLAICRRWKVSAWVSRQWGGPAGSGTSITLSNSSVRRWLLKT